MNDSCSRGFAISVDETQLASPALPSEDPSIQDVNLLLARSLNQLSIKEREEVLHDIHGVSDIPEEEPENINTLLNALDKEIETNPHRSNAYHQAKLLSNKYVSDCKFRLKFLRADSYDPRKAANRFVRHFETKLELFGRENLCRDITLRDFDEKVWKSGYLQLMPNRDRAGRALFFCNRGALVKDITMTMRQQLLFYLAMVALEDEETGRKGCIFIYYCMDLKESQKLQRSSISKMVWTTRSVPLRIAGVHVCFQDPVIRPLFDIATFLVESTIRVRMRFHFGTHLEVFYALLTYGIIRALCPINEDGNLVLGHHNDWIQTRMQKETTRTNHVAVVVPGPNDVLMGRGKIFKENPGTLRLKRIVLQQEDRYNNGSKFEKTVVIHSILRMIQDHGGRFLKKTPEGWIELSQDKAHDKISHSFRNKRKSHQRKPLTLWSTSRIY